MILEGYPTNFAPQKPKQSITLEEFNKVCKKGAVVTKKYNGNRAHIIITNSGNVKIYSRNGTLDWTECMPILCKEVKALNLPNNTFLDGELYVPSSEEVETIQLVVNSGSNEKGAENEAIYLPHFASFDILVYNAEEVHNKPYGYRLDLLKSFLTPSSKLHPVEEFQVSSIEEANLLIEELNFEGFVVADLSAPHKLNFNGNTKRGSCWKIKIRPTEDLIATGFVMSKDPSLGVGSLTLHKMIDGKWVSVGNVGSFEVTFDRISATTALYPMIVEVSHFGVDKNGNLSFPKIIRSRPDLEKDLIPTFLDYI